MEGWLARLELGDDGMMERYLTLFFFEDLKFVFPGRREGKRTGFNGGRRFYFGGFAGCMGTG